MLDRIESIINFIKNMDIRLAFTIAIVGSLCYYEHTEPGYMSRTFHSFVTTYDDLISMFIPLCIATLIFIGTAILILKVVYFIRKLVR
jgi:hypothetical protein